MMIIPIFLKISHYKNIKVYYLKKKDVNNKLLKRKLIKKITKYKDTFKKNKTMIKITIQEIIMVKYKLLILLLESKQLYNTPNKQLARNLHNHVGLGNFRKFRKNAKFPKRSETPIRFVSPIFRFAGVFCKRNAKGTNFVKNDFL